MSRRCGVACRSRRRLGARPRAPGPTAAELRCRDRREGKPPRDAARPPHRSGRGGGSGRSRCRGSRPGWRTGGADSGRVGTAGHRRGIRGRSPSRASLKPPARTRPGSGGRRRPAPGGECWGRGSGPWRAGYPATEESRTATGRATGAPGPARAVAGTAERRARARGSPRERRHIPRAAPRLDACGSRPHARRERERRGPGPPGGEVAGYGQPARARWRGGAGVKIRRSRMKAVTSSSGIGRAKW